MCLWVSSCANLEVFCRQWQDASRSAGYSWDSEQRWHCHWDTLQTPLPQCSTTSRPVLEREERRQLLSTQLPADYMSSANIKGKLAQSLRSPCEIKWVPMCLRVSSTAELRLTLDNKPRQKRSELDGSVNPSTVREGWDAWKVSPTRWFSS